MQITQEEKVHVAVTKKEEPPRARGTWSLFCTEYCSCPFLLTSYTGYGVGCCCDYYRWRFMFEIMKMASLLHLSCFYMTFGGVNEGNNSLKWNLSFKCPRNPRELLQKKKFSNSNLKKRRCHQQKVYQLFQTSK